MITLRDSKDKKEYIGTVLVDDCEGNCEKCKYLALFREGYFQRYTCGHNHMYEFNKFVREHIL